VDDILSHFDSQDIDAEEGEVHVEQHPVTCVTVTTTATVTTVAVTVG
jgi:hypothetical protein